MAGEESEESTQTPCRGSGEGMYTRGKRTQHGKPGRVVWKTNRRPAREPLGVMGWRRGP